MSSLPATSPASSRLLPGKNAAWLVNLILVIFVNKPGTAPGTGLESPETGSQNWRRRTLSRQQRPYAGYLNPRNARKTRAIPQRLANAGSYRSAWWWMQSPSNGSSRHPKFPDMRESAGNFSRPAGNLPEAVARTRVDSGGYSEIPYATEQGICCHGSGKWEMGMGNWKLEPPSAQIVAL